MTIDKREFKGDPNIGFYGILTPNFAVVPQDFDLSSLELNIVHTRIGGAPLVGLFCAGNSNGLIVPDIVTDREIDSLKDKNIPFKILDTNYTALGNLILCNDNGCIISKHLEEKKKVIENFLGVKAKTGTVSGIDIPGSCGVATNKGVLLHREASEKEIQKIEEVLDVKAGTGSINFGSPYIGSGLLANGSTVLIGNQTTGPETVRIQEALNIFE